MPAIADKFLPTAETEVCVWGGDGSQLISLVFA